MRCRPGLLSTSVAEASFTDEVARGLQPLMPSGFARKGRRWSRIRDGIQSTLMVVRNPSSFGLGDDLCIDARVQLSDGRGYGYFRVDTTETGGRNWWLKPQSAHDAAERLRIRDEIHDHVQVVALPWIDARATPGSYVAHCVDDRVPYRLIEASLAFGDDELLAEVLQRGPQEGPPKSHLGRRLYAVPAEAALRGYTHLGVAPSSAWMQQAEAVLASYRGRLPKSDLSIYQDLKARVDALAGHS